MRKIKNKSFAALVLENKEALLKDRQALDLIEKRLEERRLKKVTK